MDTDNEFLEQKARISGLLQALDNSDYKAMQYAEGVIEEADYAPIRAMRKAWRDEINQLEDEMRQVVTYRFYDMVSADAIEDAVEGFGA